MNHLEYRRFKADQLAKKGLTQRQIRETLQVSLGTINYDLASARQRKKSEPSSLLDKLKGFAKCNQVIGLPRQTATKQKACLPQQFPFPYEWTVFNELMRLAKKSYRKK